MNIERSVTRLGDLLDFWQVLKPLATINLPKYSTFLGNFCKNVEIYHFTSEIILGPPLKTFGDFFLVTLIERFVCGELVDNGIFYHYPSFQD